MIDSTTCAVRRVNGQIHKKGIGEQLWRSLLFVVVRICGIRFFFVTTKMSYESGKIVYDKTTKFVIDNKIFCRTYLMVCRTFFMGILFLFLMRRELNWPLF